MNKLHLAGALCAVLFTLVTVSANAELVSRLGGQAAYDTALDITWLTDAGLSGVKTWAGLIAWVGSLNTANHLGFDDWRLASMSVDAGLPLGKATHVYDCSIATEAACRDNELGYMYYHNLGIVAFPKRTGTFFVNGVTLTDVQSFYWSGTEHDSSSTWNFYFSIGVQASNNKRNGTYGWVVRSGDVSAVPAAVGQ